MKQQYKFLPRKLTKEDIALAPMIWTRILSEFPNRRKKALKEAKPGYNTLIALLSAAIAKRDKRFIDVATELTKNNVPEHTYLSLIGSALCDFGSKDEGLVMLRQAVKLQPFCSSLLMLAAETNDLDEKECLAKKVLGENPKDVDALRHLAYAKYFKGQLEDAESMINKILACEPTNIYALEYKGNICFDKKDYKHALDQYLKINLRPTPISLQFKICRCYHLLGMNSKAKKIARQIRGKLSLTLETDKYFEHGEELLQEIIEA